MNLKHASWLQSREAFLETFCSIRRWERDRRDDVSLLAAATDFTELGRHLHGSRESLKTLQRARILQNYSGLIQTALSTEFLAAIHRAACRCIGASFHVLTNAQKL